MSLFLRRSSLTQLSALVQFTLGVICLATSFWTEKHGFLVFRALSGIFGAMTIPSAIRIIIEMERDPDKQARDLNIFGLSGALGNGQSESAAVCVAAAVADPPLNPSSLLQCSDL